MSFMIMIIGYFLKEIIHVFNIFQFLFLHQYQIVKNMIIHDNMGYLLDFWTL